jgi:hypothetical protein
MLSLLVWGLIVAVPAVQTYAQLRAVGEQGKNAAVVVGTFRGTVLPRNFAAFAVNSAVVTHSHAITAMELPGALVQMPVVVALTNPSLWYPRQLDQGMGPLLVVPLSCLPAWWLVGLGLEALLGRRRVRWPLLALGTAVWGVFVLLLCGYLAGWTVPGRDVEGWVLAGFGLWIGMLAMVPVGWVVGRK